MFEIAGDNIAELDDKDLRNLIGLLCEAELRSQGASTVGVTWGGNQDAKDGGLDVRVELASTLQQDGYIPRSTTGFQVKRPNMTRQAIINEMRPQGILRKGICELVDGGGAYIIANSQGSVSDSALSARRNAMQEAISDYPNASRIKMDFYDRNRIASWVRNHPSIILWIRERIGRQVQGWKGYDNWANPQGGIHEEYLIDGQLRLSNSSSANSQGSSILEGINNLRASLQPRTSIRLVGLSGVGKTRLIQALFDDRIGKSPLNQSQVFYTDINISPNPDPCRMAEMLRALRQTVILIVDNCSPELHRSLTRICKANDSQIILLTVEYDVKDDEPEETEVFRLEPASDELIEKLMRTRFKYFNEIDARVIAKASGGNARIAFALASRIKRGESIANLSDEDLFLRLFKQRNESNTALLRVAEVCALVYSFDFRVDKGNDAELGRIGSLIRMSEQELYENVNELKRRKLVQKRGHWRAVLPHAVANRLAKRALQDIPSDKILAVFETNGSERLLKSFSRRLGYLHDCDEAREICSRWLSEEGILKNIEHLNDLGISLFNNIAPINPELTLSSIERVEGTQFADVFFSRENTKYNDFTKLLRLLAYDNDLFPRAVALICRFVLTEKPDENTNSIRALLKSLFHIYLSGTHAKPEQRLAVIKNLVNTNDADKADLAIALLEAALTAFHFTSVYGFEFGVRSRDYGYSPSDPEEIKHWYKLFMEYTVEVALSQSSIAEKARSVLAENFRGLWLYSGAFDELEDIARTLSSKGSWTEGWLAIRSTVRFDGKEMEPSLRLRLNNLDEELKPTSLIDLAKLYTLSSQRGSLDIVDVFTDDEDNFTKACDTVTNNTRAVGCEVAVNDEVFKELLPSLLSGDGYGLFGLGQGLADASKNQKETWLKFCAGLTELEDKKRRYQVMCGFLNALSQNNKDICEEILNEAVIDDIVAPVFPILQTSVIIDGQGVQRLKDSIAVGVAPIWQYRNLGYSKRHETINDSDLCEILHLIASRPEGPEIAIDILMMRIHGENEKASLSDAIISLGQELALNYTYLKKRNRNDHLDYALSTIIKSCFKEKSSKGKAKIVCRKIVKALKDHQIYSLHEYHTVLEAFAECQPMVLLDILIPNVHKYQWICLEDTQSPVSRVGEESAIKWCKMNPSDRFPAFASAILPYQKVKDGDELYWSPIAFRLLAECPDPIVVLNQFKSTFRPMNWSGSRADEMQRRFKLLTDLKKYNNPVVVDWAVREEGILSEAIRAQRQHEKKQANDRDERFE